MKSETQQSTRWYAAKMGNDHQGLVIEEGTGRNVAVTYDVKDAPLVALAPQMADMLAEAERTLRWAVQESRGKVRKEIVGGWLHHANVVRCLLNQINNP